jgi:Arm DNA-binding domain
MPKLAKEKGALEVSKLTAPGLHFVGGVAGLGLQVTPGGARAWTLRVSIAGRRRDMGLGAYPAVTLAMARDKAREARELIRRGVDPIERQREAQSALRAAVASALTFKETAKAYMVAHETGWKNLKHAQQWRNTLETYAYPVMGDLLVRDVQKEHVLAVLRPIWTEKNETASRLRGRIELVLSYAMQAGYRPEGLNPARWKGGLDKLLAAPSKVAKAEHHPALPVAQAGEFMQRLRAAEGIGARALEFAILTAARSGEVRGATWAEIDLHSQVWTVPRASGAAVAGGDRAALRVAADCGDRPGVSFVTQHTVVRHDALGRAAANEDPCRAAWLSQHLPRLGCRADELSTRRCGDGAGAQHREQGGGGVPPWRSVREAASDDGRLGCVPRTAVGKFRRCRAQFKKPDGIAIELSKGQPASAVRIVCRAHR